MDNFESSPVEDADASDYVGDQIAVLDAIENRNNLPVHVVGHSYGGAYICPDGSTTRYCDRLTSVVSSRCAT